MYSTKRTHDKDLYLKESRYKNPKEIFQNAVSILQNSVELSELTCVDVGCAAGEYLYYLNEQFPKANLTGYDVVPELLEKAKQYVPSANFLPGSVLDSKIMSEDSADIITLFGVHGIFDDFSAILDNLLYWCKPKGTILIFGSFNPYPVDVFVQYRNIYQADETREVGWNMFSKQGVSNLVENKTGSNAFEFIPFELSFELAPISDDLLRTWTFKDEDGIKRFTNGLSIIVNRYYLKIEV